VEAKKASNGYGRTSTKLVTFVFVAKYLSNYLLQLTVLLLLNHRLIE
jgi:hypothetical protein